MARDRTAGVSSEARLRMIQILADASGYYQFSGLPPGDYRVLASFDLSEVDEEILDAARAPVTRLDAGQRITADLPLWIAP